MIDTCMLMIVFNRLEFTKIVLHNYFKRTDYVHDLYLWDNGSTDGSINWLKEEACKSYPIKEIFYSPKNIGRSEAISSYMNLVVPKYEFIGVIDNDVLIACDMWLEKFISLLKLKDELKVIVGWDKDLNRESSWSKVENPNSSGLVVCKTSSPLESFWLAKKGILERFPFREGGYWGNSSYFLKLINNRIVIGYYFDVTFETDNRIWGRSSPFPEIDYREYEKKLKEYREKGKLPE